MPAAALTSGLPPDREHQRLAAVGADLTRWPVLSPSALPTEDSAMTTRDSGGSRSFNTADPAVHAPLELAWDNLEHTLGDGGTASNLDIEDLDHIIADLVAIRHLGLKDGEVGDTVRTTVTEREGLLTLESYAYDRYGIEWGPLSFDDRERRTR